MFGLLVMLGLIAAVVAVFVSIYRKRAQTNIQRLGLGLELPAELTQARATSPSRQMLVPAPAGHTIGKPLQAAPVGLHFMLIYDVGPDFIQRRAQFRDEHLALAWNASDAGELVLAGALEEPTEQAFLLFRGTRTAAERFAQADPYVRHGLVKQWRVKQWHTTVGASASLPMRPAKPA